MDWIALAGVVVPIVLAGLGTFALVVRTIQKVNDQAETITEMRGDIDRAAAAALEVKSLASAIETLTDKFSDGLQHIGELFHQNNEHVKTQLSDIKDELKHVRSNRAMSTPRERRSN